MTEASPAPNSTDPPEAGMDESPAQREERLSLAVSSAEVGTWNWRIPTNRILWDPVTHRLFGLEPGEFRQDYEHFAALLHSDDRERVNREVTASVETDAAFHCEYRAIWPKDGTIRWIAARGKVYRDETGRAVRMTGVVWDVSDRRKVEEELRQSAAELRRSNEELEQFAYVASHDLQEPLRMVASFVQLLGQRYTGKLDAQADEFIKFAVDGAKRMQSLIRDLLAFSMVGTRKRTLAPVDAMEPVQNALENLKLTIAESGASVTVGTLPTVVCNPDQTTMLFQNLIANGIRFCRDESPRIDVSAARGAGEYIFSVADNGIGIEPQYHARIFVIFQRLHKADQYPGTGIGLALCKKIVLRHGGRIWVDSTPGKGSIFHFSIPDRAGRNAPGPSTETTANPR